MYPFNISIIAILLTTPFYLSAQWSVRNELECDYTISLQCAGEVQNITVTDELYGKWNTPSTFILPVFQNKHCDEWVLTLKSMRTNLLISFMLSDYYKYISNGGDPNDHTNPKNQFIFCCCKECDSQAPCGSENGCGVLNIDTKNFVISIQKPQSPYCPR
jgi:hypothetical protein